MEESPLAAVSLLLGVATVDSPQVASALQVATESPPVVLALQVAMGSPPAVPWPAVMRAAVLRVVEGPPAVLGAKRTWARVPAVRLA
jgi:hypothetical protein